MYFKKNVEMENLHSNVFVIRDSDIDNGDFVFLKRYMITISQDEVADCSTADEIKTKVKKYMQQFELYVLDILVQPEFDVDKNVYYITKTYKVIENNNTFCYNLSIFKKK